MLSVKPTTPAVQHIDRRLRLQNPGTGQWLHMSTTTETLDPFWAWCGTPDQLAELRRRARIWGEAFPYRVMRHDPQTVVGGRAG